MQARPSGWNQELDDSVHSNIFIVLEQCKYSLKDVVYGSREKWLMDEKAVFRIFEQITAGMVYLHKVS
jgi:hypothetical protein